MRGITTSVEIERPAASVFDFLVQMENGPKWMTMFKSVTHVSGTPGQPGAVYEQIGEAMGQVMKGTAEIVEIDTGSRLLTRQKAGPMNILTEYLLSEASGRTTVAMTVDPGLMGAVLGPIVRKDGQANLQRMKSLLES